MIVLITSLISNNFLGLWGISCYVINKKDEHDTMERAELVICLKDVLYNV